jgi:hypothetical protein
MFLVDPKRIKSGMCRSSIRQVLAEFDKEFIIIIMYIKKKC